jgi:hypothetical protein
MDDEKFILILSISILAIFVCMLGIRIGEVQTIGRVVGVTYSDFPFHTTSVKFVPVLPNGTIMENIYNWEFEGRLDLELGEIYQINGYYDRWHKAPRVTGITKID